LRDLDHRTAYSGHLYLPAWKSGDDSGALDKKDSKDVWASRSRTSPDRAESPVPAPGIGPPTGSFVPAFRSIGASRAPTGWNISVYAKSAFRTVMLQLSASNKYAENCFDSEALG